MWQLRLGKLSLASPPPHNRMKNDTRWLLENNGHREIYYSRLKLEIRTPFNYLYPLAFRAG